MSAAPILPVPVLREAVRRAVEASSARAVAEAVGLSHRGVLLFLGGSEPHAKTVRKLSEWFVRNAAEMGLVDAETASAIVTLLVSGLPEGDREGVRADLLNLLREAHRRSGTDPPAWLAEG